MNKAKTANPDPNPLAGRTPRGYASAVYVPMQTKCGTLFVLAHGEDDVTVSTYNRQYVPGEGKALPPDFAPFVIRGKEYTLNTGFSRGPDGNWRHGLTWEHAGHVEKYGKAYEGLPAERWPMLCPYFNRGAAGSFMGYHTPAAKTSALVAILAALPDWAAGHAGDLADGRLRSASEAVRRAEEAAQKALDAWNEAKLALDLADAELRKAEARVAEFGPAKGLPAGTADGECPSCFGSVAVRLCPQDGSPGVCGDDFHRAGLAGGN